MSEKYVATIPDEKAETFYMVKAIFDSVRVRFTIAQYDKDGNCVQSMSADSMARFIND